MEKKSAIVQQDNRLSEEKDNLEKLEKKALVQVVRVLQEKYPIIKTDDGKSVHAYDTTNIKNEVVTLSEERLAECLGVLHKSPKKHTASIKNALRSLTHKACEIPPERNGGKWLSVNWINYAEHNPQTNLFEVEVSKKVIPYLLNLTKNYTQYDAFKIFNLHNKYSMRFYEKCCQFKKYGYFYMTEEEIRESFGVYKVNPETDKRIKPMYTQSHQFVKNVIDLPQKELKEKFQIDLCDFYFEYIPIEYAMGKSHPTKWYFSIGYKDHPADVSRYQKESVTEGSPLGTLNVQKQLNIFSDEDFVGLENASSSRTPKTNPIQRDTNITMIDLTLRKWLSKDPDYRANIINTLNKKSVVDVEKIRDMIYRIVTTYDSESIPRVLRKALDHDVLKKNKVVWKMNLKR